MTNISIKERIERHEHMSLSQYAFYSDQSRGRTQKSDRCDMRTEFMRDRDRIIHSKAFRRLKDKTQVFLSPLEDYYRTRLTHTLEVSQIARTIARALLLNEDLTEAIALGHDLGHTPFGHAGERALTAVAPFRFLHYLQSVRVCERIERLNLTYEVKNGIACHTQGKLPDTLEGRVVRMSDRIAYINHDIDDAIQAGVLTEDMLPKECISVLGRTKSERITALISSIVTESLDKPDIYIAPHIKNAQDTLHRFMFEQVYVNPVVKAEEVRAVGLIGRIYEHLCQNPDTMPEVYRLISEEDGVERAVCDYIAQMSDRLLVMMFEQLFIPKKWAK